MQTLLWAMSKNSLLQYNFAFSFCNRYVSGHCFFGGQEVYDGSRYIDNAGWYMTTIHTWATFFVLPAIISLLGESKRLYKNE